MPRSSFRGHECAICLEAESPYDGGQQGWAAVTSCGHVFHTACLARCLAKDSADESICPYKCSEKHVFYPRPSNYQGAAQSKTRILLPVLPLYIDVENRNPISEDDFEASQALFAPPEVEDDPIVDEEDEDEEEERDGEGELERLRRELRETRMTAREQRTELDNLKTDHDTLRQQASALEETVAEQEEQIAELQQELSEIVTPEEAKERIEELEEQLVILSAREKKARKRLQESQADYGLLQGDFNEAKIKWAEERGRMQHALDEAGESGAERIKDLEAEVNERDKEVLHLEAKLDKAGGEYAELEKQLKNAKLLIEEVNEAAKERVLRAKRELEDFRQLSQKQLDEQKRRVRALEGGAAEYKAKNKKLQHKLDKLKAKKGLVPDDEDEEEENDPFAAPPSPAKASTSARPFSRTASTTSATGRGFLRTTSSRSRMSASPFPFDNDDDDMYGPVPVVNNNSTLLASPSKRKRQRSVMDEDAWEVSAEGAADLGLSTRQGGGGGQQQNQEAEEEEDDSDIEIVKPKGKGKERAATSSTSSSSRLLAASSRHTNALPTSSAPVGRSSAFPTLFGSSTSSTSSSASQPIASGGWGSLGKKPSLSQQKTDKYLPSFVSGGGGGGGKQATLEFGQKKRPKVGRK